MTMKRFNPRRWIKKVTKNFKTKLYLYFFVFQFHFLEMVLYFCINFVSAEPKKAIEQLTQAERLMMQINELQKRLDFEEERHTCKYQHKIY